MPKLYLTSRLEDAIDEKNNIWKQYKELLYRMEIQKNETKLWKDRYIALREVTQKTQGGSDEKGNNKPNK